MMARPSCWGGVLETNHRDDQTKVPLLGDIPVLGALFKEQSRRTTRMSC